MDYDQLKQMTIKQLQDLCRHHGIPNYSRKTRSELCRMIELRLGPPCSIELVPDVFGIIAQFVDNTLFMNLLMTSKAIHTSLLCERSKRYLDYRQKAKQRYSLVRIKQCMLACLLYEDPKHYNDIQHYVMELMNPYQWDAQGQLRKSYAVYSKINSRIWTAIHHLKWYGYCTIAGPHCQTSTSKYRVQDEDRPHALEALARYDAILVSASKGR